MPRRTTRGSACASGGAGAAVTSKLDATARWSEPQGTPTSTSGPPGSPTSRLASVVAGPVTVTQSIRSSVSRRRMRGGGVPAVHVSPGRSTGSGCASRYESRSPAPARAADTGQRSGYFTCGLTAATAGVQSRCDGELKSPVRNVGTPRAPCRDSGRRYGRISPSRVSRSFFSTSAGLLPSRTSSGPYGLDGRCTLATATTRPGPTAT